MADANPLLNIEEYQKKSKAIQSGKDTKFLVVDDLPNMRKTMKNMLRFLGYENIEEADDGDTGIRMMSENPIDFVIADWVMPRLSGLEMMRTAKDKPNLKNIPFLMVTAEVDAGQIAQAAETDVDGYIIKPFVAKTLEDKIKAIINKKENPSEVEKLFMAAEKAKEKGDYGKALACLEKVKEMNPRSARALQTMGEVFELRDEWDKAETLYREAVETNPRYIKAHQALSEFYEKKGDTDKALQALEAAVEISPNNPDRQTRLGEIYMEKGDVDKAEEAFKIAVKHDPHSPERRTAIGEAYLKGGQEDRAADAFKQSIDLKQDTNVYNRLGIALRKKGKFKEAIQEYKKAIKVDPSDEVLYYNIGRAYMQDKNFNSARKAFKKALSVDPNFEDAQRMLEKLDQGGY